ncbi:MAG: hypothetical protein ABIJ45_14385, partial [Candidatus Zixiibacteriota bacterium]
QTIADQASAEAAQEKEKVRVEDSLYIERITGLIAIADTAITKAPRGKGTKADIELLKSEVASVRQAFQSIIADYNAEKYLVVKSQLVAIETKLNRVINDIQIASSKVTSKK